MLIELLMICWSDGTGLSDESDVKMIESQHGEETEDFLEEANEQ